MLNSTQNKNLDQIKKNAQKISKNRADIALNNIFSLEKVQNILFSSREYRQRVFDPLTTTLMFVKQVLSPDKSSRNAVAEMLAKKVTAGKELNSSNTGPYTKARQRLSGAAVQEITQEVGQLAAQQAGSSWRWRWRGRDVKMADGTTVTMPDTAANQKKFPQHGNQEKGAGFPMARIVAVMSLSVGTVLDYAIGAYKGKGTGEMSLLWRILDCLKPTDVFLGDRYYPSFF